MINKNIYTKRMVIRNIEKTDFTFINNIYNNLDFYYFAIGENTFLDVDSFEEAVKQNSSDVNYFYCVSRLLNTTRSIGCIKGSMVYNKEKILWITSIMVHKDFWRKQYGSELVREVINYYKINSGIDCTFISVAEKNKAGRNFWSNLGFSHIKSIEKNGETKDKFGDILIYCKDA